MDVKIDKLSIEYGKYLMAKVTTATIGNEEVANDWQAWTHPLFENERNRFRSLQAAWTLISVSQRQATPAYASLHPVDFSINPETAQWSQNPTTKTEDFGNLAKSQGEEFAKALSDMGNKISFDRFFFLMKKYASALPNTYGEEGVSLFQQWRMVVAIMAMSKDADPAHLPKKLALIGLDLPGIQQTIYTIASRGAGKMVRGRSAFVQLLVNAVVERIVDELHLCRANVIINAGGNALILAGWEQSLTDKLDRMRKEINQLLFNGLSATGFAGFQGDLSFALVAKAVPLEAIRFPLESKYDNELERDVSLWQWHEKQVKEALRQAKQQPFQSLYQSEEQFVNFFSPDPVVSSLHCAVCQRPDPEPNGSFKPLNDGQDEPGAQSGRICQQCDSFRELADALGKDGQVLSRQRVAQRSGLDIWQQALHAVSDGYLYSFAQKPLPNAVNLAVVPDLIPAVDVDGVWYMATTTPRITAQEAKRLREAGDNKAEVGNIRDNEQIAEDSLSSFKRLGILKADVDDLGNLLAIGRDKHRSVALTAALSESLTLYFGGWLDRICQQEPFVNKVYVLYAGGDDLLIVGSWHVMPLLASRIANDFRLFTGKNPNVHLSAAINVVDGKAPLYASVNEADKMLKKAKQRKEGDKRVKNAISFMDQVHSWDDFAHVSAWSDELVALRNANQIPAALFTSLIEIYEQFLDDQKSIAEKRLGHTLRASEGTYHYKRQGTSAGNNTSAHTLHIGPWLWTMIYRLRRLAQRRRKGDSNAQDEVIEQIIQRMLTHGGVHKLAHSARWAQLLTRKDEKREETNGKTD